MAKLDIYVSDDLKERLTKAAPLNVSGLCQPVLGYAVLHGQEDTEARVRRALSNGHADVDHQAEQLGRIEQLVTGQQEGREQLAGRVDTIEERQLRAESTGMPIWAKVLAVFVFISLALSGTAACLTIRATALA